MTERIRLVNPEARAVERWGLHTNQSGFDLAAVTEEVVRAKYNSAGILPISTDGTMILLGAHPSESGMLWGPFAGSREDGETPESTALREAYEESGIEGITLNPPTVLVNATKDTPKIGVVFPVVLSPETSLHIPNEEITQAGWFGWGNVMELLDEANPAQRLWGNVYTCALLREWMRAYHQSIVNGGVSIQQLLAKLNSRVAIEGFYYGETPFEKLKAIEKLEKSKL